MTDTATDPKVATLVTSLDAQVNHVIHTLQGAGVDLKHGVAIQGCHNWRLTTSGLVFNDAKTPSTQQRRWPMALADPINFMARLITRLARMTHPRVVNELLAAYDPPPVNRPACLTGAGHDKLTKHKGPKLLCFLHSNKPAIVPSATQDCQH